MPKLPTQLADAAASADDSGGEFSLLPAGIYRCRLDEVKAGTSKTGNPKWDITYVISEGPYAKRKVWETLPLHVDWRVKRFFDSFDRATDTDTDLMLGELVDVKVTVGDSNKLDEDGNPKQRNEVDRTLRVEGAGVAAGQLDEEPF